MHLSRYLKAYPSKDIPDQILLYSTLRGSLIRVSSATLEAARTGELSAAQKDSLTRIGMLVADPDQEKEQMREFLKRADARSRNFTAIVVLNLSCNLDCEYCYEGGFRGENHLTEATAQLLVDTLIRDRLSQGLAVTISFYGGEPLLSRDMIRRISEPLLEAAHRNGTSYGFTLVTNGTLLSREVAEEVIPVGLKAAKFTLDGPPEIHDKQRPFASGAGSFAAILDNLAAVCDLIAIQLGGNFLQENYREFPRLLDHLLEKGITPDKLAQVLFTPITPQAGCSEYNSGCASSSAPWLVDALLYLRGEILARGFATTKPAVSACVVELENNMVVNWDGSLYKCPTFMGWPDLSIGNLSSGLQDYRASHCIGNWQNDECLECPYLPLCFGGCRFLTLLNERSLSEVECRRDFLNATLEEFLLQNLAHPVKTKS